MSVGREFWIEKNGKLIKHKIPKNNHKVPRTKRLRKKKFWMFCVVCKKWFKRYAGSHGTRKDGGKVCKVCMGVMLQQIIAERKAMNR